MWRAGEVEGLGGKHQAGKVWVVTSGVASVVGDVDAVVASRSTVNVTSCAPCPLGIAIAVHETPVAAVLEVGAVGQVDRGQIGGEKHLVAPVAVAAALHRARTLALWLLAALRPVMV